MRNKLYFQLLSLFGGVVTREYTPPGTYIFFFASNSPPSAESDGLI